jgi:hypothetical protein
VLIDNLGASGAIGYCGIATLAGALPVAALGRRESAAA